MFDHSFDNIFDINNLNVIIYDPKDWLGINKIELGVTISHAQQKEILHDVV